MCHKNTNKQTNKPNFNGWHFLQIKRFPIVVASFYVTISTEKFENAHIYHERNNARLFDAWYIDNMV